MQTRQATPEEIIEAKRFNLRHNSKTRFRHFVREIYAPRAKNGVRHQQYSSGRLQVIDGVPHVKYQGEFTPATATVAILEDGKEIVFDLRIKSDYLP